VEGESKGLPKAHILAVDRLWLTPAERATKVNAVLKGAQLTEWDVMCFAVEYIGMQSIAVDDEDLTGIAVALGRWLYTMHYNHPARLYGKPDRPHITIKDEDHEQPPVVPQEGQEVSPSDPSGDVPRGDGSDAGGSEAEGCGGELRKLHVVRGDQPR